MLHNDECIQTHCEVNMRLTGRVDFLQQSKHVHAITPYNSTALTAGYCPYSGHNHNALGASMLHTDEYTPTHCEVNMRWTYITRAPACLVILSR